ncbi:hypothetical protein [Flavobacterium sp.]|uniref:hypothetical protein n=1 Tax=Flavobacterium sp. TaxID=239 RepID=UPI00286AE923|nr:hypothetical protein [Flavobacterium sp.]
MSFLIPFCHSDEGGISHKFMVKVMINLKNIFVGFLVSFIGSIPLGYLNVVGFQVFQKSGLQPTIWYLAGVICIEFLVIYLTLIFAHKLAANEKLTKYIEGFSVVFMFILAAGFYFGSNSKTDYSTSFDYSPFVLGIVLSCLNFIQIPFWTGWNLWLLNGKYIEVSKSGKYFYVSGTVVGTFCGMLVLILSLHYFASNVDFLSKYLMQIIIPLVFVGLGVFQGVKFFKKYYR